MTIEEAENLDSFLKAILVEKKTSISSDRIAEYKFIPNFNEKTLKRLKKGMEEHDLELGEMLFWKGGGELKPDLEEIVTFIARNGFTEIYKKIEQDEERDDRIKELTEKDLRQSIWQIKYWWVIVLISVILTQLLEWIISKIY